LFDECTLSGGHRLYSQQQIDLINRVVGLLDRGMRIGQVKKRLEAEQSETSTAQPGTSPLWRRYQSRMLAGVIQFDESALEQTYGDALAVHAVETVTAKLITPLLKELGRRWEDGEGTVAEEHFFGCYLRNKLGARFHHRIRTQQGPKLLLACLPGDRHETGMLLFALAAKEAGYQTILLGADMPLEDLPGAARKTRCAAIVLSGLLTPAAEVLQSGLRHVVTEADAPVFVGGRASVEAHDSIKRAGAEPLGSDIDTGLAHLNEYLATESTHSKGT
jgi:methanogenic corrinoid protein MtbC1